MNRAAIIGNQRRIQELEEEVAELRELVRDLAER